MSKNASKGIEKRLETLERSMKKKDDEIIELKSALRSTEKNFADELHARDAVITDLFTKIDELKSNHPPPVVSPLETDPAQTELGESSVTKTEHDLLVLGDSLLRDINPAAINPGGDTTIECAPGARPEDLVDTFNELSKTKSFKRVIIHAGTNLIPKFSPITVAEKIIDSLEKIRKLSPHSKVAFSAMLPKEGDHLLHGINEANRRVHQGGLCGHYRTRYGFVSHAKFFANSDGEVNRRLFQRDGTHLTDIGSRALEKSLDCLAKL